MSFKVGDKIKVLENWNEEEGVRESEYIGQIFTILKINPNYVYNRKIVTQIVFNEWGHWAEPHEVTHLTPLEELL